MKCMDEYNFTGQYFKPVLITDKWQMAYLNSSPELRAENLKKVDIHLNTDEAFVLLQGNATLTCAEIAKGQIRFDIRKMKPGIIYNIPKKTYHNITLYENTRVLIVENANTHLDDFDYYWFSDKQNKEFLEQIKAL
jgi:mannose-6-phosphate isomerase-like protein (cupin superfamily)